MLLYLYGPDSYRRNKKINFYLNEFKKKHASAISIDHFDLSTDGELLRFADFVKGQSLFGRGYKLAVIHGAEAVENKDLKPILNSLFDDKATIGVVSSEKKLDKPIHTLLQKSFKVEKFDVLKGSDFLKFLKAEAGEQGVALKPENERDLINLFEGDTWGLVQEISKIKLGAEVLKVDREPELFPLMFQIARPGSIDKKLSALAWLLEREEAAKVFNIISAQKNESLQKKMATYDAAIKSGKLNYEEALLDLTLT